MQQCCFLFRVFCLLLFFSFFLFFCCVFVVLFFCCFLFVCFCFLFFLVFFMMCCFFRLFFLPLALGGFDVRVGQLDGRAAHDGVDDGLVLRCLHDVLEDVPDENIPPLPLGCHG